MWHTIWHWILHYTGSDNVSGRWYGFWSGFGGDVAIFTGLFTGLYHYARDKNCHVHGCWRIGRMAIDVNGHTRHVCKKHHPHGRLTHQDVLDSQT
jgi:hypothetical protein